MVLRNILPVLHGPPPVPAHLLILLDVPDLLTPDDIAQPQLVPVPHDPLRHLPPRQRRRVPGVRTHHIRRLAAAVVAALAAPAAARAVDSPDAARPRLDDPAGAVDGLAAFACALGAGEADAFLFEDRR